MSATAEPGAVPRGGYGPPGWSPPPAGPNGPPLHGWNPWSLAWSVPKPWLIVATVLGFIAFWPIGLAVLFFLIGSGRLGRHWMGAHAAGPGGPSAMPSRGCGWRGRHRREEASTSGNAAFDEYRQDTLRRLEEEQRDFAAFLERLRFAKDKAEFDQFMADRRGRPEEGPAAPESPRG